MGAREGGGGMAIFGNMGVTASLGLVFTIAVEMYPTVVRSGLELTNFSACEIIKYSESECFIDFSACEIIKYSESECFIDYTKLILGTQKKTHTQSSRVCVGV